MSINPEDIAKLITEDSSLDCDFGFIIDLSLKEYHLVQPDLNTYDTTDGLQHAYHDSYDVYKIIWDKLGKSGEPRYDDDDLREITDQITHIGGPGPDRKMTHSILHELNPHKIFLSYINERYNSKPDILIGVRSGSHFSVNQSYENIINNEQPDHWWVGAFVNFIAAMSIVENYNACADAYYLDPPINEIKQQYGKLIKISSRDLIKSIVKISNPQVW